MPRRKKYRFIAGSSERAKSSPLQETVSETKLKDPNFSEAPGEESKNEPSGFTFMGLVFFGSDSEEELEEKPSDSLGSRKSISSKSTKQKMIQLTKLRKKETNGRYQLHDSDDFSNSSEGTTETALLRYLNQKALPVSSPDKIMRDMNGQSKQGSKVSGGSPSGKQRSSKALWELDMPKDHILSMLQSKKATVASRKPNAYVQPRGIFFKSSLDDCDDNRSQGSIQRIQPFEEKRQQVEEFQLVGRTTYETFDEEDKPKSCKLWPGGKNRQEVLVLTYDEEDDDADSFLQFPDDQRESPEVSVKNEVSEKKIWDHSDLLERMDSLEEDIRGTKTKSCFLIPARDGRGERDPMWSDSLGITKGESFSDLVEERKNKRGFFPLWKASKSGKETSDSSGNTDVLTEYSREQPNENIYFGTGSTAGSFEEFFDERKLKTCWPGRSSHKRPGDNDSMHGYLLLPPPSKRSREKRMRGPSRRVDTERKRCFPPIIQRAPEDEHHAVVSAADDVAAIIEKQVEECRHEKAIAVHEPKNTQWRQLGGFGTDSFLNFGHNDDQSFISRDQDWSVAASSVISGKRAGTNMRPLLDDDPSTEDDYDGDSFDSGWFTLESLAA